MTSSALKRLPRHERPHKLDVLGALLMTAATMSLLLALSWGGTAYPWRSRPIAGLGRCRHPARRPFRLAPAAWPRSR